MSYPGNPILSETIQQRVLGTFGQTLELAEAGKRNEALLGCEFVLKLDPLFEPARALQKRIEGTQGPVAVQDLRRLFDAKDLAAEEWSLGGELADLLDRRDFHHLLQLAAEHKARVAADPDLEHLVAEARSRLEAEPYVRSFLDRALQLRKDGHEQEAEATLVKARQLDPTHPELARVSAPPVSASALLESVAAELAQPATGDERITRLLAEGQRAFERADYQGAIDSWSRIFLIDIDHGEANRRIEEARRHKAERERQLEELYHEGVSLWELGSNTQARRVFERVLEMDSGHLAARDAIERIDAGEASATPGETAVAEVLTVPEPEATPTTSARTTAAPAPAAARRPALAAGKAKPGRTRPAFWAIGGAVLLLALAGGWLLYSQRQGLFPNSESTSPAEPADSGVLERARKLHELGQTASAIDLLRRLPAAHAQYVEAQSLIAQWETLLEEGATAPTPEQLAERAGALAEARSAAQQREHLRAVDLLDRAAAIAPLEPADGELLAASRRQVSGLQRELDLFRQGDWEFALPELWRLHDSDPANPDINRLIVDSYYNLAVRDLQRQDLNEAVTKLEEGLALAPQDAGLERLARFARLYTGSPPDLRYRIFVKYLPFR
jgi:tetratricopeptide (TPR) repeat protein